MELKKHRIINARSGNLWFWVTLLGIICLHMVIVFGSKMSVQNVDSYGYIKIARGLVSRGKMANVQYPFLYPLLLTPAFLFGDHFLDVMGIIQVILSALPLVICYFLLKDEIGNKHAVLCGLICSLLPVAIRHSALIMSENLFYPLVLLIFIFHFRFRGDGHIIRNSILAGVILFAMFATKYISLPLAPLLCIYWGAGYYRKDNKMKGMLNVFISMAIYTGTVLSLITSYALYYCYRNSVRLSVSVFRKILGFSVATGPDRVGYVFLPEMKWIVLYFIYILMISVAIICALIMSWNSMPKDSRAKAAGILRLAIVIGLVFLYAAARHSTLAPYNADGVMKKMLARYVTYISALLVIPLFYVWSATREQKGVKTRSSTRIKRLVLLTVCLSVYFVSYLILFRSLIWELPQSFLNEARGFDLSGIYRKGIGYVAFEGLLIILIWLAAAVLENKHHSRTIAICLLLVVFFLPSQLYTALKCKDNQLYELSVSNTEYLPRYANNQKMQIYSSLYDFGNLKRNITLWQKADEYAGIQSLSYINEEIVLELSPDAYFMIPYTLIGGEPLVQIPDSALRVEDYLYIPVASDIFTYNHTVITAASVEMNEAGKAIMAAKAEGMSSDAALVYNGRKLVTVFNIEKKQYEGILTPESNPEKKLQGELYLIDIAVLTRSDDFIFD